MNSENISERVSEKLSDKIEANLKNENIITKTWAFSQTQLLKQNYDLLEQRIKVLEEIIMKNKKSKIALDTSATTQTEANDGVSEERKREVMKIRTTLEKFLKERNDKLTKMKLPESVVENTVESSCFLM